MKNFVAGGPEPERPAWEEAMPTPVMLNLFQHPGWSRASRAENWTLKRVQGDGDRERSSCLVIPGRPGIHEHRNIRFRPAAFMDSGFRRNDEKDRQLHVARGTSAVTLHP